jgi:hypothetical protein
VIGGGGEKTANEELQNLYSWPGAIRMMRLRRTWWANHVARKGNVNAYRLLVGKPHGKRSLRRPRCRSVAMFR